MAIVLEGIKGAKPVAEICREPCLAQTQYYQWRDRFLVGEKRALTNGPPVTEETLTREIEKLQQLIGKQAVAIELTPQPDMPSSAGLTSPENPLPGSGYVNPQGHTVGKIKGEVEAAQERTYKQLAPQEHKLHHEQHQADVNVPTRETVDRGLQKAQGATDGGAVKAFAEVQGEVAHGVAERLGIDDKISALHKELNKHLTSNEGKTQQ